METRKQTSRFTIQHRVLHWTMGLAISILFITGFLRMYWMNKHRIISVIKSHLSDASLSDEQMTSIATDIRAPMWQGHEVVAHEIGRAHVGTPVTWPPRMPSCA